jgi:hypothetical protein
MAVQGSRRRSGVGGEQAFLLSSTPQQQQQQQQKQRVGESDMHVPEAKYKPIQNVDPKMNVDQ